MQPGLIAAEPDGEVRGRSASSPEAPTMADPIPTRGGATDATIVRQDNTGVLTLPNDQRLEIRAGDVTITLDNGNLSIRSSGTLRLEASSIDLTASLITLNAGMVRSSGVINCDTIVARSVVGASYTPGAGNIW
jgi:hypothetical protein